MKTNLFLKNTALLAIIFMTISCGSIRNIPIETKVIYDRRDSLIIKDSVVYIPKEKVVDIVPVYDTLYLSIQAAESKSWVDTSLHCLRGEIEAKKGIETKYVYRDRIVKQIDSVYVEKPYPVEVEKKVVPRWCWYTLGYTIVSLIVSFLIIWFKIKK